MVPHAWMVDMSVMGLDTRVCLDMRVCTVHHEKKRPTQLPKGSDI